MQLITALSTPIKVTYFRVPKRPHTFLK